MDNIQFPVKMEFRLSLFTEIHIHDATGRLLAVVKEKFFSVRDEVRIFSDENKQHQIYGIKAKGFWEGALDWKAKRLIVRSDDTPVGALSAQGLRTLWGASYDVLDAQGLTEFTIKDDMPWLSLIEGALDVIPFVGDFVGMAFDYFVNPTFTITDSRGRRTARVHKHRSFFSRRFEIQQLRPMNGTEAELLVTSLIQLVLSERDRG